MVEHLQAQLDELNQAYVAELHLHREDVAEMRGALQRTRGALVTSHRLSLSFCCPFTAVHCLSAVLSPPFVSSIVVCVPKCDKRAGTKHSQKAGPFSVA